MTNNSNDIIQNIKHTPTTANIFVAPPNIKIITHIIT